MALPRYIVLKSKYNNKYLNYVKEDGEVHGFLKFSGQQVVSPYAKHEVVVAKTGGGLVHIRCCYNNKYWSRWSEKHFWIVSGADEPVEDQSKWSCTLFKPVYLNDRDPDQGVRFCHVQLGHYACLRQISPPYDSCFFVDSKAPNSQLFDVCSIVDWGSLLVMPKHVAFKGDNGKYLSSRWIEKHQYHMFASDDIGDPTVGYEVFTTGDGSLLIKSDHFGKFWRRSPNWIWADSNLQINFDPASSAVINKDIDPDMLFWPIKLSNNVVALRNLGNNNFCKRLTTEGKKSCLNAGVSTISREARLELEELVVSRDIYNVDYRLMDARIYNQSIVNMATGNAINKTNAPNTVDLKLSYTKTKSTTWNASGSVKLGGNVSLGAGIPQILDGKIEISGGVEGAIQWAKTETSTSVLETTYVVTVPPMTMMKVSMLATLGSCDVPFSYTQRDTLTNGKHVTINMDDGVYTGMNSYSFKYETEQENLSVSSAAQEVQPTPYRCIIS